MSEIEIKNLKAENEEINNDIRTVLKELHDTQIENEKLKAALASIILLGFRGNWQTARLVTKARQALEETE